MSKTLETTGRRHPIYSAALEPLLQELQNEPLLDIIERERTAFDCISWPFSESIVLFGAGALGRYALDGLRKVGIQPLAFSDNNTTIWGKQIDGLEVLPPHDAADSYRDNAVFVVTIYNGTSARRQLDKLHCKKVAPFAPLFWKYSEVFIPSSGLELPHRILEQVEEIKRGYSVLSDDISRREFCEQLRWRVLLDFACLSPPQDKRQIYFPSDLVTPLDGEIFVDCGAFDGDSIRSFLSHRDSVFGRIYALEPDPSNRQVLQEYVDTLPKHSRARIAVLPYAVGSANGMVGFNAGLSAASAIAELAGAVDVECRTLDDLMMNLRPTYIKMDTEGAEPEVILGAAHVIKSGAPVLAACVYHKCEHLWRLPMIIHSISPDLGIYLRRYAEDCWELVCYAIPSARLAPSARKSQTETGHGK